MAKLCDRCGCGPSHPKESRTIVHRRKKYPCPRRCWMTRQERIAELREIVGPSAVRSLQTSGTLNIWRNSSPHNWWVESKRKQTIWHCCTADHHLHPGVSCWGRPDLSMFEVRSQRGRVRYPGPMKFSDEGSVMWEVFTLKKAYRSDNSSNRNDSGLKEKP